jgi:hypothetical protein
VKDAVFYGEEIEKLSFFFLDVPRLRLLVRVDTSVSMNAVMNLWVP